MNEIVSAHELLKIGTITWKNALFFPSVKTTKLTSVGKVKRLKGKT